MDSSLNHRGHKCILLVPNLRLDSAVVEVQEMFSSHGKRANVRDRYNLVPHLTQCSNGKVTNSPLDITSKSQEVSPFTAGDHEATINRCARRHSKHSPEITCMIHKRSTAFERSVKYFTGGLTPVSAF